MKRVKKVKKVKKVKEVVPEQLAIDGRPAHIPNEPFWCGICKRSVILKPNGECPRCHNPLLGLENDEIPF